MFEINTERLRLIPLDIKNYKLYLEDTDKMEENLGLTITNTIIEEPLRTAHKITYDNVLKNIDNYLWETNWIIVLKEENKIIGGIMIKGEPNEFGEVIIGYGINDYYQNKGYMTESVMKLKQWIFKNCKVKNIIADTDKDNVSSHKVLKKNGFKKYKETIEINDEGEKEFLVWWKLKKECENVY
ncbi:GNAT family N-acetyltransferase [Clostridium senegalense]|uniref:GNAT family N-acetyltransferase n=1 Tax=Clostridium senegalense TaxID=1465809 RepID=UPI001C102307|nr:GNAT family N-acetyltransferase [Clostridium senegalense]MBU5227278.1 GNAT family N-acetyltransferase [Clostridium senegalense]